MRVLHQLLIQHDWQGDLPDASNREKRNKYFTKESSSKVVVNAAMPDQHSVRGGRASRSKPDAAHENARISDQPVSAGRYCRQQGGVMMNTDRLPTVVFKLKAVVYVRQTTQAQAQMNFESQRRQYDLLEVARRQGFSQVEVIDDDSVDQPAVR